MKYLDLEHLTMKLDGQAVALSNYKIFVNGKINNLDSFKSSNESNLNKLNSIITNGISISDFESELRTNLESAINVETDLTELVNRDTYLDNIKANKSNVYTKTESDNKLSDFYTKTEIDEKVDSVRENINDNNLLGELQATFDAYRRDAELAINSLQQQINELKALNVAEGFNIESIEIIEDMSVEIGTDALENLPETINVTLANGNVVSVPITWKTNTYDKDTEGTYVVEGILNLPANISNSNNLYPVFNVIVNDSSLKIVSVDDIEDVYVEYMASVSEILAKLPNVVNVTLSDNSTAQATINWDARYYSETSINDQTITGSLNIENVKNPNKLKAQVVVKTIIHDISTSTLAEQTYERDYSINFVLPETVNVTLDNDSVISLPVNWNTTESIDTKTIGEVSVTGEFTDLPVNVKNTNNINTSCTINLIENQNNISSVINADGVTIPLNITFENVKLDKQATVTLVSGEVKKCDIVWDGTGYDRTTPGSYTVYGDLVLGNLKNFNNLRISSVIVISEDATDNYEWSYKFIVPNGASQIENFAQKLGVTITEDEFYGPWSNELDDYDYAGRKIELRYLGSTLQDVDDLSTDIDKTQIKKTGIIDAYGNEGLLIPYMSQEESMKDEFDNNVVNAGEPNSNRAVDYYDDSDILLFESKALSNQIYLIRKIGE